MFSILDIPPGPDTQSHCQGHRTGAGAHAETRRKDSPQKWTRAQINGPSQRLPDSQTMSSPVPGASESCQVTAGGDIRAPPNYS